MATGTTQVAVKKALRTALSARSGLTGVQVSYAKPNEELQAESIWFGSSTSSPEVRQAAFTGGGRPKTQFEAYDFLVTVQVLLQDGRDEETADERAALLLAELQQALAAAPTLGVDGVKKVEMSAWEHDCGPIGESTDRGARYDVTVSVMAELKP